MNSHPRVIQSQVFGKKNAVLGMLVVAEVINEKAIELDDQKAFKKELITFCKDKLESFKIPVMIKFVEEIAVNESGKIERKK